MEVPSLTVEQFWSQVTDFGIDEVDLIKLNCEGAEYSIISELTALRLMDRIGWIRGEWHSRKDNLLLANLLSQTHVFKIDPNYPHSVGMSSFLLRVIRFVLFSLLADKNEWKFED